MQDALQQLMLQVMQQGLNPGASPLQRLQHRESDGLWTLLLEREFNTRRPEQEENADRFEWEDRLSNSVLLVLKCPPARLAADSGISRMPLEIQDLQTTTPFILQDIQFVLCPQAQEALVRSIFPSPIVFSVENVQCSTPCRPFADAPHREYLEGPNYAKKLEALIAAGRLSYPFALHIVRLTCHRDFLKLPELSQQLSMEAYRKHFKNEDPDVLLRRAAAFGRREDIEYILPYANVDGQSPTTGQTALHQVLRRKDIDIIAHIKALLKAGAKMDIPDIHRKTAKQYADELGISLENILSGEYDKQIFIRRAQTDPEIAVIPPEYRLQMGQAYRAPS